MVNGVVRSVELLYHQLLALGHDVRVVTLARWYIPTIPSTRIIPSTFSSVSVWAG